MIYQNTDVQWICKLSRKFNTINWFFGCFLFCFTLLHLFSFGGYAVQLPNISHLDAYYNLWTPGLKLVLFHVSFSELELIIWFLSVEFYLSPFLYIWLTLLLCGWRAGWVTGPLFPPPPVLSCSFLFLPDFSFYLSSLLTCSTYHFSLLAIDCSALY